mgnify:CR=1 FL=1
MDRYHHAMMPAMHQSSNALIAELSIEHIVDIDIANQIASRLDAAPTAARIYIEVYWL